MQETIIRHVKLSVSSLAKTFRLRPAANCTEAHLPVLDELSFDVYQGEIVSLIAERLRQGHVAAHHPGTDAETAKTALFVT